MTTGKRIKGFRVMQGLKQADLAEAVGVSLSTVKNWEWDKTSPRVDEVLRMAEVLGRDYTELIAVESESEAVGV